MKEEILISVSEYNSLRKSAEKLDALEANGVDNWIGYSEALSDFNDEEYDD